MIRAYETNRRRFGFQAGWFRSSLSVRFKIQRRILIGDRNFDLNSIYFQLKLITLDLFLIYVWLKDQKWPSKCQLINRKRWIISKTTIYIKNLVAFNNVWLNSTNFPYKLNPISKSESKFELSRQFRWIFSDNFGSQMSIKSRFETNSNWKST